jgi:hypothetical protein
MKKNKLSLFAIYIVLFSFAGVGASYAESAYHDITPFTNVTTRELGWGGVHSAYNDDFNVLWTNPAALYPVSSTAVAEIGAGIAGNALREATYIPSIFAGEGIDEDTLARYAEKNMRQAPPDLYLHGPLSFVYIQKGFGMSANNKIFLESIINYENRAGEDFALYRVNLNNDAIVNIGHSYVLGDRPKGKLYWGFSAKLFYRNVTRLASLDIPVIEREGRQYTFIDSSKKNILGLGSSVGLFYTSDRFSFGVTIDDALSGGVIIRPQNSDGAVGGNTFLFYPRVNAGVAFIILNDSKIRWVVMGDVRDALGAFGLFGPNARVSHATPFYNISIGTELIFYEFAALRVGMSDLFPCAGFGFTFGKVNIDFAFFGKNYNRAKAGDFVALGLDMSVRFKL